MDVVHAGLGLVAVGADELDVGLVAVRFGGEVQVLNRQAGGGGDLLGVGQGQELLHHRRPGLRFGAVAFRKQILAARHVPAA